MAAVVRVKRRLEEDPLETLILNCKRKKPLEGSGDKSDDVSAVLRLAGTSQKVSIPIFPKSLLKSIIAILGRAN